MPSSCIPRKLLKCLFLFTIATVAVRDDAHDEVPKAARKQYTKFHQDDQHHDLQSPIPTQQRSSPTEQFKEIDWFQPTTWELAQKEGTLPKGVLAESVQDIGKAAQQMQIWAAEAGTKMKHEEDEYNKFTKDMDGQEARAQNLHNKMKEEIEKKDKIRMKLMKLAAAEEGPHLYFNEDDLKETTWHKDEPEHMYTLESLGLEDAQEVGELEEESDFNPLAKFKLQPARKAVEEESNDWIRILDKQHKLAAQRGESKLVSSPFTVNGAQARREADRISDREESCTDKAGQLCEQVIRGRTQICEQNEDVHASCRLSCGDCDEDRAGNPRFMGGMEEQRGFHDQGDMFRGSGFEDEFSGNPQFDDFGSGHRGSRQAFDDEEEFGRPPSRQQRGSAMEDDLFGGSDRQQQRSSAMEDDFFSTPQSGSVHDFEDYFS